MDEKALFVPLCGAWFDAFAAGTKTEEWRRYGARWNERTCRIDRVVTLARGYGWPRLSALIAAVNIRDTDTQALHAVFGSDGPTRCLVMTLRAIQPISCAARARSMIGPA